MSPINIRHALAGLAMLAALAAFAPVHAAPPIPDSDPDPRSRWRLRELEHGWNGARADDYLHQGGGRDSDAGRVPVCSITADDAEPAEPHRGDVGDAQGILHEHRCQYVLCLDRRRNYLADESPRRRVCRSAATTTFTVVATNASGPSVKQERHGQRQRDPPRRRRRPRRGALSCPGYHEHHRGGLRLARPKAQELKAVTTSPFGNSDIVVARFTTPANLANNGAYGLRELRRVRRLRQRARRRC